MSTSVMFLVCQKKIPTVQDVVKLLLSEEDIQSMRLIYKTESVNSAKQKFQESGSNRFDSTLLQKLSVVLIANF